MKKISVPTLLLAVSSFPFANAATVSSSMLTLEQAKVFAGKAEQCAKKKNWHVSIAVVNSEGNLVYFQRDELAYSGSIESAIQKAKSSNAFQRPTRAFVDAVKDGRTGILTGKDVVAIEGGIPLSFGGKHLGAIGLSGAKAVEDEECAKTALD